MQLSRAFRTAASAIALLLCGAAVSQEAEPAKGASLDAGDLVFINVHRQPELSTTTQLDANGNVDVPYIGNVTLKGLSLEDASARVSMGLKAVLKNPKVTVSRSTEGEPIPGGYVRTASMQTQVVPLNSADAESLQAALSGMSSGGGSVSFDPNTNSMILTDEPAVVQNMLSVIRELDQMKSQITQVLIESKIVEVETAAA